jgi:hypothetical protein
MYATVLPRRAWRMSDMAAFWIVMAVLAAWALAVVLQMEN